MKVCEYCLMAIESHEGYQHAMKIWIGADEEDEDFKEETTCEWCEEYGFDTLYEI